MARPALVLLLLALPGRAELSPEDWERARRDAAQLAGKRGELEPKLALIGLLGTEDSARTARLLLDLAAPAAERRDALVARTEAAHAAFLKVNARLRRRHGYRAPRETLEADPVWRKRRDAYEGVRAELDVEIVLLEAAGRALSAVRAREAALLLADAADRDVARARGSPEVCHGILAALLHQPADPFAAHIVPFASDPRMTLAARVRVLDWIAAHRSGEGFDAAVRCLADETSVVARAAVAALMALDDPRCVPGLGAARAHATGLLSEELDLLLHRFTGRKFRGPGADVMWAGWWRDEGEAWLRAAGPERYEPEATEPAGGAEFYGIATRSNRIVFVLDRSHSMRLPVPGRGAATGVDAGDTKLEIAKQHLARTIGSLGPEVKFGVVFYGAEVHAWEKPPALLPATPDNRRKAVAWFATLAPEGSTRTFDALDEALRYAKTGGGEGGTDPRGADTIFLLSDGSPTGSGSAPLTGAALDEAVARFLEANRAFRCVVHTIGVGPDHNRALLARLARETGGTYRSVADR